MQGPMAHDGNGLFEKLQVVIEEEHVVLIQQNGEDGLPQQQAFEKNHKPRMQCKKESSAARRQRRLRGDARVFAQLDSAAEAVASHRTSASRLVLCFRAALSAEAAQAVPLAVPVVAQRQQDVAPGLEGGPPATVSHGCGLRVDAPVFPPWCR